MRAGGAPKRAECALSTHLGARHGNPLCIICANRHFLREARFFPKAQRRDIAARARPIPELSKNPPERPVIQQSFVATRLSIIYYIYYYMNVKCSVQENRNKFPEIRTRILLRHSRDGPATGSERHSK